MTEVVVVYEQTNEVVVLETPPVEVTVEDELIEVVVIEEIGLQGPPGAPGPAGGEPFEFVQSLPSSSWVVNNGLNRPVGVFIYVDEALVSAQVDINSLNSFTIQFNAPQMGRAVVV